MQNRTNFGMNGKNGALNEISAVDKQAVNSVLKKAATKHPKTIIRLYRDVRNGQIVIKDVNARNALSMYLADVLVEEITKKKRVPIRTTIGILCILTSMFLGVCLHFAYKNAEGNEEMLQTVQEIHASSDDFVMAESSALMGEEDKEAETLEAGVSEAVGGDVVTKKEILPWMAELAEINSELAGWLCIEGTEIDYPVVQTIDNKYYVSHDFYGEENSMGNLFLDYRNTDMSDTNLIIYGHNMRNGAMFGSLSDFEDYDFFKQHQLISFETLYDKYTYRVVAVCIGKVAYRDEEGFRYYNFTQASSGEELQTFWEHVKARSVHEITYEFREEDRYLTLSTCNNFTENGRTYVIAVRED